MNYTIALHTVTQSKVKVSQSIPFAVVFYCHVDDNASLSGFVRDCKEIYDTYLYLSSFIF